MEKHRIYKYLEEKNQLQLLKYMDELSEEEKEELFRQIQQIDFDLLDLIENKDESSKRGKLEPLGALTTEEIKSKQDIYYKEGIQAIREGKIGAVLLAGGQGTRLGFDKPKGMLDVGVNKELYLFQILITNTMDVVKQADAWIPLFIMTSEKNHDETVEFFKKQSYFGYQKEFITFFKQDMAPSVDYTGRIYLEGRNKVSLSPNGNGGWYSSLKRSGILSKIKEQGVEWFNVFSVDNVMQKIADPYFVGAVLNEKYVSGAKVVAKAGPEERVGVLCLEDGRPSIVEYYEMTEEMKTLRDEQGRLLYNYGVILNYLLSAKELERITNNKMPLHIVEKKIPYINENGIYVKPDQPNGYKFETLILDMIHMMDNCLAFEVVREKEFAPIKNKEGVDSLETARKIMVKNGICI